MIDEPVVPAQDASAPTNRLGRRLATALYWALTVYVVGAGALSIVPQVFWPGEALGTPPARPAVGCGRALDDLRADLLDGAADRVRSPTTDPLRPWLEAWDRRYRALRGACGRLRSYELLARLRYGVEEHLLRFQAEAASLAIDTRRAIHEDLER